MSVADSIASSAEQVVHSAGYTGLALVMAAEAALPIPSEVVLPVVGLQVSAGQLSLTGAALAATIGSVLGAWALYALGRLGGRPMVARLPRFLGATEERMARVEGWFARRGDVIVLLARLVPGVRSVVSIPAGTLRMPLGRFLVFTTVGSLAWNAALIGLGSALAARWASVLSALSTTATYLLPATAAGVIVLLVLRRSRALGVEQ
jgi:membrane protein DedA with SNARE-associated domain